MTSIAHPVQTSAFAVFRNRSFARLWTAQLISVAGSALSSLAAAMLVYRLTGSALSVGLMLMVAALPSLLVGLIAGVLVDRLNRKHVMIAADLLRAVLIGAIPLVLPLGVGWLYAIVLLASAVGQFFEPAHASVLPEVAAEDELAAANSMMAISGSGSWAIGFTAAGLIVSQLSIEWAFYLDALTFLISALCILGVRVGRVEIEDDTNVATVLRDLRAGGRFLARTPSLRALLLVGSLLALSVGLTNALLLPFALSALHASEFEYSLLEGMCSVGFIVGSLLMARLADRLHACLWIAIGEVVMALAYIVFALSSSLPVAIVLLMVSGLFNAPSAIGRQLVIQRNTSSDVRGRVYSAFFVVRDVLCALGMAAAGLADLYSVRVLFIAGSIVALAAGALVLIVPGLRRPAAEWRRALRHLPGEPDAPGLGRGRAATLAQIDVLVSHLPLLGGLGRRDRQALADQMLVHVVPNGAPVVRSGEAGDSAFFILDGRAAAGCQDQSAYRRLELLGAGDFFGEIAALTGLPRTADVVAEQVTTVLQVPVASLRWMITDLRMRRYLLSRMTERMQRMDLIDLPRAVQGWNAPRYARATSAVGTTELPILGDIALV
jgi:MFS family permease